jgi:hypothetical protein
MYRAFDKDEKFGREQQGPLEVPIALAVGGNSFVALLPEMAIGLKGAGARVVATETISRRWPLRRGREPGRGRHADRTIRGRGPTHKSMKGSLHDLSKTVGVGGTAPRHQQSA